MFRTNAKIGTGQKRTRDVQKVTLLSACFVLFFFIGCDEEPDIYNNTHTIEDNTYFMYFEDIPSSVAPNSQFVLGMHFQYANASTPHDGIVTVAVRCNGALVDSSIFMTNVRGEYSNQHYYGHTYNAGIYEVKGWLYSKKLDIAVIDVWQFTVEDATQPPSNSALSIYSGDISKGCPGDKLFYPNANSLRARVDNISNTCRVVFEVDAKYGSFENGFNAGSVNKFEVNTLNTPIPSTTPENAWLAQAVFILAEDNDPENRYPDPPYFRTVPIHCYLKQEATKEVYFHAYGFKDKEHSHIPEHETDYHQQDALSNEVSGDNYVQIAEWVKGHKGEQIVTDPGTVSDYKDVLVELDWFKWDPSIQFTDILMIGLYVEELLGTAGINAFIGVDQQITTMGENLTYELREPIFISTRNYFSNDPLHTSNYPPRIHVILGTTTDNLTQIGITDNYRKSMTSGTNYSIESVKWANDRAKLDKVGCFICAKTVWNGYINWSYTDKQLRAIALTTAHEIAHALGMGHCGLPANQETVNIMSPDLGALFNVTDGWSDHSKFLASWLNGSDNYLTRPGDLQLGAGVNTRHKLGVDCVNIMENGD
jgi:hypothetical protein